MNKPYVDGPNWFEKIAEFIDLSKPVQIYRNLHKKCFSVRQGLIVRCHVPYIFLKNCDFIVREGGRQRVLREKKKNVHAFVQGFVTSPVEHEPDMATIFSQDVSYNPYKYDSFVELEGETPVKKSLFADMYIGDPIITW